MTSKPPTVADLAPGSRVWAEMTDDGPAFSKAPTDTIATVTGVKRNGRMRIVETDCGTFRASPLARVLLAEPVEQPADDSEPATEPAEVVDQVAADDTPAPLTASVNVDQAGRLHTGSVVTIGDQCRPVPARVDLAGGGIAPVRLAHVLTELGYRPAGRWERTAPNVCTVAVAPLGQPE